MRILCHGVDPIVRKRPGIPWVVSMVNETARRAIVAIETSSNRPDPKDPLVIFDHGIDVVVPRAACTLWIRRNTLEHAGAPMEPVQTDLRSDPEHARTVFKDDVDTIVGNRLRILRVVSVVAECPIGLVQPSETCRVGSNPDRAVAIFVNCPYGIVGERLRIGYIRFKAVIGVAVISKQAATRADPRESR